MTNRFAVGVDFKYSHTAIKKIKDSKDITPINAFTIQTAGIYATASVFFGGRKTKGDTGKMYYYTGDYITSKRFLEEFVDEDYQKNPMLSKGPVALSQDPRPFDQDFGIQQNFMP